jgi:DNA-binding NarL/FixJ family response regulator
MPFDILLVDDHRIVRDGIRAILERHPEFRVAGEAASGQQAIQFLRQRAVDVVLLDIHLPDLNGVEAAAELRRHCPDARIIMLSMDAEEEYVMGAMRNGARGFVLKENSSQELIDALRNVARGGTFLSPKVSETLMRRLQNGDVEPAAPQGVQGLSRRELQVMRMVAEGKTSKDIAVALDLGLQTVRSYRKTMMKKLGVSNVAGLTQMALAHGITDLPEAAPAKARAHANGAP